jgi:peptidyl-prolyl cis-trans isomerase-like protein 2
LDPYAHNISFIAYRALPHLNNKHTIFGRLIDDPSPSSTTLDKLESAPVDSPTSNRPAPPIHILDVTVFVDPFEEFLNQKREADEERRAKAEGKGTGSSKAGPDADDERLTWTGKRVPGYEATDRRAFDTSSMGTVGKYLKSTSAAAPTKADDDGAAEFADDSLGELELEHVRKKMKTAARGGQFGNFDGW